MPDCSHCNRPVGRERMRCYNCGACETCCDCDGAPDVKGFNPDTAGFDRDELGENPEED